MGFVVYDLVANNHERKVDLLKTLMRIKFNAVGPLAKHQPFLKELPEDYGRFMDVCSRIRGLSERRNRIVHDVYQCWIGIDGVSVDRTDLRKGHESMLVIQPPARVKVIPEDIHGLAKEVHDLTNELAGITKALILPTTHSSPATCPAEGPS